MALPDPALLREFKRRAKRGDFGAWLSHPDTAVRQLLARFGESKVPRRVLRLLARDVHSLVRLQLAGRSDLSAALMGRLAQDPVWFVREAIAKNRRLPPALASRLARAGDKGMRERLAGNPSVPPAVLDQLASDRELDVVSSVLKRGDFVPGNLADLAASSDYHLRKAAIMHPGLPPHLAEKLAKSRSGCERALVASSCCDDEIRARLAQDRSWHVRYAIAAHKDVPINQLIAYTLDAHVSVRHLAFRRLQRRGLTDELIERCMDDSAQCIRVIAAHSRITEVQMAELAMDRDPAVRRALLWRQHLPAQIWMRLSTDPDFPEVRKATAHAWQLPRECIEVLAGDADAGVRYALVSRPRLPAGVLARLREDTHPVIAAKAKLGGGRKRPSPLAKPEPTAAPPEWTHPLPGRRVKAIEDGAAALLAEEIGSLSRDPARRVRAALARQETAQLPPDVRSRLATDASWVVRAAFSQRRDLTEAEAATLAADPHERVRLWVAQESGEGRTRAIFELLIRDPSSRVRHATARNQGVSTDLVEQWASGRDLGIVHALASRHDLSPAACVSIAIRGTPTTGEVLGANESLAPETLETLLEFRHMIPTLATNEMLPGHLAEGLLESLDPAGRARLAWRPTLSDAAMLRLAQDPSVEVRRALAGRRGLSLQAAAALAADQDPEVTRALCGADQLAPEIALILASNPDAEVRYVLAERHESLSEETIAQLVLDADLGVRSRMARRHDLPDIAVRLLAEDKSPRVREVIAERRSLPGDIRDLLAGDVDGYVRNSATRALGPEEYARQLASVMDEAAA